MNTSDASEDKKFSRPLSRLKQERELKAWTQSDVAEKIGTTQVNVSRWEKGITSPSPYYRKKLGELFGKSVEELGLIPSHEEASDAFPLSGSAHSSSSPIWNIPYRRNPFFTGRENILDLLYSELQNSKTAVLTQAQAISGLGGIGKTQIAVEYAYRYREVYQFILWVTASSRESLTSDFVKLAALLDLPEQLEQDQEFVLRAVNRWLSTHDHWLLILDNVDNLEMLADFLPVDSSGNVLITTRLQALGSIAQSIEVEKMGLDEGARFLLRRTKLLAAGADFEQSALQFQEQVVRIVAALDGLPLALDQAGAYIEETRCSLSHYLDLYGTSRKELLRRRGGFPVDHPDSVAITWSISFQKVEHGSIAAADLLHLLAFLDPEAIPEEIISKGAEELGCELEQVADDPLAVDTIIELLLRYSLIRRHSPSRSLSIHRLVQAVLKDGMNKQIQRVWAERAIRAVNRTFPEVLELETWEACERCLPHVLICSNYIEEYELAFPEAARLFNEAATYLAIHAQYELAELLLKRALSIRQRIFEPDHLDTARTLNDLGFLYLTQSKFQLAEPLLQQALDIRQNKLGIEHADTASSLHNRAQLFYEQGYYPSAEQMYLEALQIRRRLLQPGHPDVAQSLSNLAELYTVLGKYSQAELLHEEALKSQENSLGTEHPLVAQTLNNMALLYRSKGEYTKAEQYYQQALEIQEQVLGSEHPDVAETLNNLARLYRAKGEYEKAEPLYQSALHIRETTFGADHPQVAQSYYSIAKLYHSRGRYSEAEKLFEKALHIQEQRLGTNHPTIASTLGMLAKTYQGQNKLEESEKMTLRALQIRESTSGADHPHIAIIISSLIEIYQAQKRFLEVEPLIVRSREIHERAWGLDHPYMAYSLIIQADNLFLKGDYTQAELYYKRALAIREKHLGIEHPYIARTYYKLAKLYFAQGRDDEAKELYSKTIAIYEGTLGHSNPIFVTVQEEYSSLLRKMNK